MDDHYFLAEDAAGFIPEATPQDDATRLDWLRLVRSRRVGPTTFRRLLLEFGTARAALAAMPEVARKAGVSGYEICPIGIVESELRAAAGLGARLLCLGAPDYPQALSEIADAPPLLWALGDPALASKPCIALVGARNASALGQRMARKLAADLGELGYVTVSGLARGIDSAVHAASLATGTIAVQAGGVDNLYPPENSALAADIAQFGARLSEAPIGMEPQARDFPRRNRIISGLARAVIVVEGAAKSGSLITARCALDQGREVMAVPGHPFDARASGCNMLIRDGAILVRGADDIHAALTGQQVSRPQLAVKPVPPIRLDGAEGMILSLVGPSPVHEDLLIRQSGAPAHQVSEVLMDLELRGLVARMAGGMVALAPG